MFRDRPKARIRMEEKKTYRLAETPASARRQSGKKPYRTPRLVEWGSLRELTRQGVNYTGDLLSPSGYADFF